MTDDSEHMTAPAERLTPALRDDLAKALVALARAAAVRVVASRCGTNVGPRKERLVK
jgi:hypothetical protein